MSANYGYALDPGLKGMLAAVGIRHQDVLRRAGLPEDLLNRPDVRVSTDQYYAFTHAIEASIDDPQMPVQLVDRAQAELFSPPVFAALCSPDLSVALQRLAMLKPLLAPVGLLFDERPQGLRVGFDWLESTLGPPPFLVGIETLFLVKLARMGTRHLVIPIDVRLPTLPRAPDAYEDYLGCTIGRGPQMSVTFSREDATRPFLTDNSAMWDIFEPQLRKRLVDLEGSASYEARTRAVLMEALPSGQVSIEVVARRLAVSSRTLQRRLRDEGTSFNAVVRDTRKNLSMHYLRKTRLTYREIAYLLGFQEPNSFFRAFQGWTGTTPESLRQSLQPAV